MQMIADLHTHTLCATHAYNTFTEMAAAAKALGYCALAVTDHAPRCPMHRMPGISETGAPCPAP